MVVKSSKIIILVLMLLAIPVFAANWQQVGYKSYIDYSTWNYANGLITVWFKDLNPGDWELVKNKKVWYRLSRLQFNCSTKEYNIISVLEYDLKGNVVNGVDSPYEIWYTIPPDTIIDEKYHVVCGGN